jgi:hypothetical protein
MGRDQIEPVHYTEPDGMGGTITPYVGPTVSFAADAVEPSADYADVIAFVMRRTGCKPSIAESIVGEVAAWLNAGELKRSEA